MCKTEVIETSRITSYRIVDSISELLPYFENSQPPIFLTPEFFQTLEKCAPQGMSFIYLMIFEDTRPKHLFPCQIHHFHAVDSLKNELSSMMENSVFASIKLSIRRLIAKMISFNTLVIGNLLLTGEFHSYTFPGFSKPEGELFLEVSEKLRQHLDQSGVNVSVVMIKDFVVGAPDQKSLSRFKEYFHNLKIQPNMRFRMNPGWNSYTDYLEALTSKYRIRARRARKKLQPIKSHILDIAEIRHYREKLNWLYRQVSEQARFNLFQLHIDYFQTLAKTFPDSFQIRGYFLKDQLVAFSSYFKEETKLDAHFLGYHKALNVNHHLYLNMLLDLVEAGIDFKVPEIVFSRTAMEIKSSVGARGEDSAVFVQHRRTWIHRILPQIFKYLSMDLNWTPRNPFRE